VGPRVRIMLDSFFDPSANSQAAAYLNLSAQAERLDLVARLANPAGLGLHNKLVLVQSGGVRLGPCGQSQRKRGLGQDQP
jgi:hypothetical protein